MRVSISYTREDSEHIRWVEKLATDLRYNGIKTVLDMGSIEKKTGHRYNELERMEIMKLCAKSLEFRMRMKYNEKCLYV